MLYPVEIDDNLYSSCKRCGFREEFVDSIVETHIYGENLSKMEIPTNVIYDNTLCRTIHKKCPNPECITHKKPELQEAVFVNDKDTLIVTYICVHCKKMWKLS